MRKYNIVIVENDEDEQEFMRKGFDAFGSFNLLIQVESGDQLLEWLQATPDTLPDVILSDLNMAGKNGYDIIDFIKHTPAWSHIPVIITSTSNAKTVIDRCILLGAADYIVKPDSFIEYEPFVRNLYRCIEEKNLVK